jgi:hypothetical protein
MQRLFSMFPTGWPGLAVLLLRVALCAMLVQSTLEIPASSTSTWITLAVSAVALVICLGFITPLASVLAVASELAAWHLSGGNLQAIHICAILVAAALAMLGPGAYSLDARLFGRRHVIFSSRDKPDDN